MPDCRSSIARPCHGRGAHRNAANHLSGARPDGSGDDVGQKLILAPCDLVPQPQLVLLHAGELELVGNRRRGERDDRRIEVAMLGSKPFEALGDVFRIHARLLPRPPLVRNGDRPAESSRLSGQFMFYSALPTRFEKEKAS